MKWTAVVLCCVLLIAGPAFAQPTPMSTPPPDPNGGEPPGEPAPISGIEILIAMGGILGFRKLYKGFKEK